MHSVTWLSHRKSRTSPNSIPKPLYLFCTSYSLNKTYFWSFISSLAYFYFKFRLCLCEKEMSWELWKRDKDVKRKRSKEKNVCMEKKRKKKKERGMTRKIWRGWVKWRINKVQGRMSHCCWETKLPFFFQPCAIWQRGRHRCLVVLFLLPLHMSTILYLLILDMPTLWFNSHDHWLWKVNNH
jgi:hypothetical protein